jgi:arylformamidase
MKIDLEAEYNNRARVPEHPEIIAGWARDAAAYRSEAGGRMSVIAYGDTERQRIDVFAPERPDPRKLPVLFFHGGYWQALHRDHFSHMAKGLNVHGVTVGIVGYDLCPDVTINRIVSQTRVAVQTALRTLSRPFVVTGHSAGGHLAACMLETTWVDGWPNGLNIIDSGLAISGLFDLEPLVPTSVNAKLGLTPAAAHGMSPRVLHPRPGIVFECWVGADESSEYLRQSRTLAAVWAGCGAATAYVEVPGANHFTVIAGLAEADSPITRRLAELSDTTS